MILANGTRIEIGPDWVRTTLPCGSIVHARPNGDSAVMARKLGYGSDVAALTRDHDPLHAIVTDAIGLPFSFSLMRAAGQPVPDECVWLEEAAILKLQRMRQRWRALSR